MASINRILLVEDEIKLGQVVLEELIRHGYPTDLAIDGLEATKFFNQHNYSFLPIGV